MCDEEVVLWKMQREDSRISDGAYEGIGDQGAERACPRKSRA